MKTAFVVLVMALLAGLLAHALSTGAVWIKGTRRGAIDYRTLAHRRERSADPVGYWSAVGFYALALAAIGYYQFSE